MLAAFIAAIHAKKQVRITFFSKKDGIVVVRKCAPMDYGPFRGAKDGMDRFHLWDYEGDTGPHTLPLQPDNFQNLQVLDEVFDPGEFVTWTPNWHVVRDWGRYS